VPMKQETWRPLLDDMESKNIQILKLRSSHGLPRHDLMRCVECSQSCSHDSYRRISLTPGFSLHSTVPDQSSCEIHVKRSASVRKLTPSSCQEPNPEETFLKVYNCDYIKPPRPSRFARAMKQIYRPSYVLSHFVHYSTVTADIARYHKDNPNMTAEDELPDWENVGADKEIFLDELEQGSLIHARSVLPDETIYRLDMCRSKSRHKCPLGYVCPDTTEWIDDKDERYILNPFVDEQ
jgi:hypothetical protein